jgi:hypothetical protein
MDFRDLRLRGELLATGLTDGELQRLRRTGALTAIRRGAYVPSADERLREPAARHELRVRATVPHLAAASVVSHVSAVVLHGLPVWSVPLDRVHVTRDTGGGGRLSRGLHVHVGSLQQGEMVDVGGIAVTSVARTIVDVARSAPFEQAVVIADAALRMRLVDPAALAAAQHRVATWRGGPAAGRVVAFADGGSASVGESRSRVALRQAGLPVPVLQWEVRSAQGGLVGRVDFGWPQLRTVGEFDGRVKYGRLLRPGQDPGDAVFEEKRREDDLRAQRLSVVRWTWADLDRFDPVAARLRRGFAT